MSRELSVTPDKQIMRRIVIEIIHSSGWNWEGVSHIFSRLCILSKIKHLRIGARWTRTCDASFDNRSQLTICQRESEDSYFELIVNLFWYNPFDPSVPCIISSYSGHYQTFRWTTFSSRQSPSYRAIMRGRVEAIRRHIEDRFKLGDKLYITTKRVQTNNVFEVGTARNETWSNLFSFWQISVCGHLAHSRRRGDGLVDNPAKINNILQAVESMISNED